MRLVLIFAVLLLGGMGALYIYAEQMTPAQEQVIYELEDTFPR